jgi:hypothetical protein
MFRAADDVISCLARFGLHVRSITQGDLYAEYFNEFVTSLRRSDCYRPSDRLAGWDSHPLEIADFHGVHVFRDFDF